MFTLSSLGKPLQLLSDTPQLNVAVNYRRNWGKAWLKAL
jgi:hypothetical protein